MTNSKLGARLDKLLTDEYHALISGDIANIEKLSSEKLSVLQNLGSSHLEDYQSISSMRERLIRNQILTLSAIEGIKSAISKREELEKVVNGLQTYDAQGKANDTNFKKSTQLSKKA